MASMQQHLTPCHPRHTAGVVNSTGGLLSLSSSTRYAFRAWPVVDPTTHLVHSQAMVTQPLLRRPGRHLIRPQAMLHPQPLITSGPELWACLAGGAALAQLSGRTAWGQALSSPLVAMGVGIALAAGGVLPVDCPGYDVVWQYLMPMAASCFMLETDLAQLLKTGGPTFLAFLVGGVGMVLGALAGYALLWAWMGPEGGKLAACLCGSYVGGSVNFAAVAKVVSLPAAAVPAAMAVDNIAMAGFLGLLGLMPAPDTATATGPGVAAPSTPATAGPTASATASEATAAAATAAVPGPPKKAAATAGGATAESIALTLATSLAACSLGKLAADLVGLPSVYLMFMALISAISASVGQRLLKPPQAPKGFKVYAGAAQFGSALMSLFFVVIGLSAGSLASLARTESMAMLVFLTVMVFVHWVWLLAANTFMRLPLPALILGSNAAIGGPATAAAMADAKGWSHLVQPAMLTGSTGYAFGTMAGLAVARGVGLVAA